MTVIKEEIEISDNPDSKLTFSQEEKKDPE